MSPVITVLQGQAVEVELATIDLEVVRRLAIERIEGTRADGSPALTSGVLGETNTVSIEKLRQLQEVFDAFVTSVQEYPEQYNTTLKSGTVEVVDE